MTGEYVCVLCIVYSEYGHSTLNSTNVKSTHVNINITYIFVVVVVVPK